MKLAVFGATGGTGRQLIVQAIAAGHTVTALARSHHHKLPAAAGLTVLLGSSGDRSSVVQAVAGQEAVLCALGGRPWRRREEVCSSAMRYILPAMREHGVRRLVAISTFGAGDTRPLVGPVAKALVFGVILRSEVADKEAMEAQIAASDVDWTIVRVGVLNDGPRTGVYRARDDGSVRGMGKISRADVANFILSELNAKAWLRRRPVLMY